MDVEIIVPVYNGRKYLDALWKSLKEGISKKISWKLTLVDDASTDGTFEWGKSHPEVNYIRNQRNMGFAKTCNRGARSSDSEWILFLNQDIVVKPSFLEEMLKVTEKAPWPKIVGAKLIFPNEKTIQHAGIEFTASGFPFEYGKGQPANLPKFSKIREVNAVTGACMLIKRDLFEKLGGFDEEFINSWEDVDLCLRAKERGARIFYCGKAEAIHYLYSSEGRFLHELENKNLFKEKWIHHRKIHVLAPFWMAVAVTWKCNLRCKYCNIWKQTPKEDLNVEQFQSYIAHEFYSSITNVAVFGGEPTLFPKLVDFLAICADRWKGREIGIITNGTNPENQRRIWETVANNLRGDFIVRVSIDGREKIHDKLRGQKGTFIQAIETVKFLNTLWPGKGGISITVYPETVDELPYLLEIVENLGTTFCIRAGVSGSYFGGKVEKSWTKEKIDKLEQFINKVPSKRKSFDRFTSALCEFLRTGSHKPCEAYRKALVVDTNLDVSICHERPPFATLENLPLKWGKTPEWCMMGYECLTDKCFKRSCFIDGPFSTSLILD